MDELKAPEAPLAPEKKAVLTRRTVLAAAAAAGAGVAAARLVALPSAHVALLSLALHFGLSQGRQSIPVPLLAEPHLAKERPRRPQDDALRGHDRSSDAPLPRPRKLHRAEPQRELFTRAHGAVHD